MGQLFAVMLSRGPQWNASQPLEGQIDWPSHAEYMDALEAEGFIALGGPLEGTVEVLLIARARDTDQIKSRLAHDVWHAKGLLRIDRITPWTLRLGSL